MNLSCLEPCLIPYTGLLTLMYMGCLNPGWIPDTGLLTLMNLSCLDPCLIPDTGLQTLIIWAVLIQVGSCRYRSVNPDESELSRTVLDPIYRSANPDYLGCLNPGWIPDTGLLTLMYLCS